GGGRHIGHLSGGWRRGKAVWREGRLGASARLSVRGSQTERSGPVDPRPGGGTTKRRETKSPDGVLALRQAVNPDDPSRTAFNPCLMITQIVARRQE